MLVDAQALKEGEPGEHLVDGGLASQGHVDEPASHLGCIGGGSSGDNPLRPRPDVSGEVHDQQVAEEAVEQGKVRIRNRVEDGVGDGDALLLGGGLYKGADAGFIDGIMVNGTANTVAGFSAVLRHIQTGFTYHYAFAMIIGLFMLISFFVWL